MKPGWCPAFLSYDLGIDAAIMAGVLVFKNLMEAKRAGYEVYERTDHGYLVRARTRHGWAIAIVDLR